MSSRNQVQGLFVGKYGGKMVRMKGLVPPIYVGNEVLFPECKPYVDSSLAWLVMYGRDKALAKIPARNRRYIKKADRNKED